METCPKRKDVAKMAGVSESTVSRALSRHPMVSEATKKKVKYAAQALGYVPNRQAAFLAKNKTYRLGLVIPSYKSFPPFSRSYFPALLDGVVLGAEERNYSITVILDKKEDKFKI